MRKGQPAEGYYETGPAGERIKIDAPGRREAISGTLHEIQHAINRREGFPTGVPPEATLSPEALAELASKRQALRNLQSEATRPANAGWLDGLTISPTGEISGQPTSRMGQVMLQLQERINELRRDAYEGYRKQPSEIMARNVQTRRTMTPVERLRYPPWETEGK